MIILLDGGIGVCITGDDAAVGIENATAYPSVDRSGVLLQWCSDKAVATEGEELNDEVILTVQLPDSALSHLIAVGQAVSVYQSIEGCYKRVSACFLERDDLLRAQGAWGIILGANANT